MRVLRALFATRADTGNNDMSFDPAADKASLPIGFLGPQDSKTPEVEPVSSPVSHNGRDYYKIAWGDGRPDQVVEVMPEEMFDIAV